MNKLSVARRRPCIVRFGQHVRVKSDTPRDLGVDGDEKGKPETV